MKTDMKRTYSEVYTPMPFWFWNDRLNRDEIKRQMEEMRAKGVMGFVIHPRLGLTEDVGYLTDTYFSYVEYACELAEQYGMEVILYDEAMYPSGSCRGEVVRTDPSYASQGLALCTEPGEGILITETKMGQQKWYFYQRPTGGTIRGIFPNEDDGQPLAPASADLLNRAAVQRFLELTHDRYYEKLAPYFGSVITSIFTDEPNIVGRMADPQMIAWSEGIYEEFLAAGGRQEELPYLFEGKVPELTFDEIDPAVREAAREKYRRVIYDRMSRNYYKQLMDWCHAHGIALTGHPEKSTDIGYLKYFDIPCQDIVWRFIAPEEERFIVGPNSCMGKCSSDSARHRGKVRNGNECFGVCGHIDDPYAFTEADMRWYTNWLLVRGVNLIIPHAFYYSLRDERKDERPPEVGLNNPFWPEYSRYSSYVDRICRLLTGAVNQADIAVLCTHDRMSWKPARPLFENQIEFNYLEEELLTECRLEEGVLKIASQQYKVLLADEDFLTHAEKSTLELLQTWQQAGLNLLCTKEEAEIEAVCGRLFLDCLAPDIVQAVQVSGVGREFVRTTLFTKEGKTYCFMTNEGPDPVTVQVAFGGRRILKITDPYMEREQDVEAAEALTIEANGCRLFVLE